MARRRQTRLQTPSLRFLTLQARRVERLDPTVRGLLWVALSGFLFVLLNAVLRGMSQQLHPMQAQFLRYLGAVVVMLPMAMRAGLKACWPNRLAGQFYRGALHTLGLLFWFAALPNIPLADTTAIGFIQPMFIMVGAWLFLHEAMRWERWVAALIGFAGVMVVVGPQLSGNTGWSHLLMLASSPVFAASFLLTKTLTRYETINVIVLWQAVTVALFSLPMAIWYWQSPGAGMWMLVLVSGVLGVGGHYCQTRGLAIADASPTQSIKFLDLIWATFIGFLFFGDLPTRTTLIGGAIISVSTIWIAQRESRRRLR
ncbi:MAG: DMT family transporter [Burkholderiaceae bacterium]